MAPTNPSREKGQGHFCCSSSSTHKPQGDFSMASLETPHDPDSRSATALLSTGHISPLYASLVHGTSIGKSPVPTPGSGDWVLGLPTRSLSRRGCSRTPLQGPNEGRSLSVETPWVEELFLPLPYSATQRGFSGLPAKPNFRVGAGRLRQESITLSARGPLPNHHHRKHGRKASAPGQFIRMHQAG